MNAPKIMAIRMGIYACLVSYLLLDFFVFKGPLHQTLTEPRLDPMELKAEAKAEGVVARAYGEPIYRKQVEERMKEHLWRRGRTVKETTAGERRLLRELLVNELIDELLAKIQVRVSPVEQYDVSDALLDGAVADAKSRHGTDEVFEELAERSSWEGRKEQRMRLAGRRQRENYLTEETALYVKITDEEAKIWYDQNKDALGAPFDDAKESIKDTLSIERRRDAWKALRRDGLRFRVNDAGRLQLFEEVLYAE